jgi:hypothetical protein
MVDDQSNRRTTSRYCAESIFFDIGSQPQRRLALSRDLTPEALSTDGRRNNVSENDFRSAIAALLPSWPRHSSAIENALCHPWSAKPFVACHPSNEDHTAERAFSSRMSL